MVSGIGGVLGTVPRQMGPPTSTFRYRRLPLYSGLRIGRFLKQQDGTAGAWRVTPGDEPSNQPHAFPVGLTAKRSVAPSDRRGHMKHLLIIVMRKRVRWTYFVRLISRAEARIWHALVQFQRDILALAGWGNAVPCAGDWTATASPDGACSSPGYRAEETAPARIVRRLNTGRGPQ
jgi:hypothetical protein